MKRMNGMMDEWKRGIHFKGKVSRLQLTVDGNMALR
jgi:hypothetical protein